MKFYFIVGCITLLWVPFSSKAELCNLILQARLNEQSPFSLVLGDEIILRSQASEKRMFYLGMTDATPVDHYPSAIRTDEIRHESQWQERPQYLLFINADDNAGDSSILAVNRSDLAPSRELMKPQPIVGIRRQEGPDCVAHAFVNCVRQFDLLKNHPPRPGMPMLWKRALKTLSQKSSLRRWLELNPGGYGQFLDAEKLFKKNGISVTATTSWSALVEHGRKGRVALLFVFTRILAKMLGRYEIVDSQLELERRVGEGKEVQHGFQLDAPARMVNRLGTAYAQIERSGSHAIVMIGSIDDKLLILDSNTTHLYLLPAEELIHHNFNALLLDP